MWEAFHRLRDADSRSRLVEHYMPFARSIAAKLYGLRVDAALAFDDYLQYGRLGLLESIDRFDAHRSASFETYSGYRIRGAILNGIVQSSEAAAQVGFWKDQARSRMESLQGNLRTAPQKASLEDLGQLAVELALGLVLELSRTDPADEAPESNPYAVAELAQLTRTVRRLMARLPVRERELLEGHYFEHLEFQWLAERLGITKGRVSQLHAQALARLRQMLRDDPAVDRKV